MKKTIALVLALLCLLSLCACAKVKDNYTVRVWGEKLEVNRGKHTISDGTHTYSYKEIYGTDDPEFVIYYPNGSTYDSLGNRYNGTFDGSYVAGDTLYSAIKKGISTPINPSKLLVCLVCIVCGLIGIISPYTAWKMSIGWRFRDAEPSELALNMERLGGVIAIAIGVIVLIFV
jgi:uncharacterized protein YjeT (DUF2065 family)